MADSYSNKEVSPDILASDSTWKLAYQIAQKQLNVSSGVWHLLKGSWLRQNDIKSFMREASFSRLNLNSLLVAAGTYEEGAAKRAPDISHAIESLGIRLASVVLGINYTCQQTLLANPPTLWRRIFQDMMTYVEIGYKLGARATDIGIEGGALAGFARGAGISILLAVYPKQVREWHQATGGFEGKEMQIRMFGCESYQVSAAAIQQLGFGQYLALGAALAYGRVNTSKLSLDPETNKWKAAFEWIDSLRQGRSYPSSPSSRDFFREIKPPKERGQKNLALEVLYTEVAKVKVEQSNWLWHLPKPSYEQTIEDTKKKKQ